MLWYYQILLYLIFPFIWVRLLWRSLKAPAYRRHWGERLGFIKPMQKPCIWFHAASMGETIASAPLVQLCRQHFPDHPILFTTMTPTGRDRAAQMFFGDVEQAYIAYDYPGAVRRFLDRAKPMLAIFIETELWPNMFVALGQRQVPVLVTNARLSEKSYLGYAKHLGIVKRMLANVTFMAAQTEKDKERFQLLSLPGDKIQVTGSIKFDIDVKADITTAGQLLRLHYGEGRLVFIAASTHEGEEKIILEAFKRLHATLPQALLIIVPRHPERFDKVAALCASTGLPTVRRSQAMPTDQTVIYVGDTMGELMILYASADVAFVGGSFIPQGGHNPLEPAALKMPILMGRYVFNFEEICRLLREAGGLQIIDNGQELTEVLLNLLQHPALAEEMGDKAYQVVMHNRGALERQWQIIATLIKGA